MARVCADGRCWPWGWGPGWSRAEASTLQDSTLSGRDLVSGAEISGQGKARGRADDGGDVVVPGSYQGRIQAEVTHGDRGRGWGVGSSREGPAC